jgi:hypothetical protein
VFWAAIALAVFVGSQAQAQSRGKRPSEAANGPADYRSQHFLLHTDLPPDEANHLLARLETMLGLISEYWGRPLLGIIECYVVKDLGRWPDGYLEPEGKTKIEQGAGVTLSRTLASGNRFLAKATVYAVADHGTPLHEAVHAYCAQTFGTTGPTWYSEGMAEMGNYWRPDDSSVQIEPEVLTYLKESEPKSLNEIVNKREFTGDSWRNYAWRWALCHLLANNPNYAPKFRPLGLALLTGENATFEGVYGDVADQISFEYLQFLECLENGFRADLCSWDWNKRFVPVRSRQLTTRVQAARGWQPTGAALVAGQSYQFTTNGSWQLAADGPPLTAAGEHDGHGKLVGVLFQNMKLTKPFDLGAEGTFTAPSDGQLYVRCQDDWGKLADNKGSISFKIRVAKK